MPRGNTLNKQAMTMICEQLVAGKTLRAICSGDDKLPSVRNVVRQVSAGRAEGATELQIELAEMYDQARQLQAECFGDLMLETAEQALQDDPRKTNAYKLKVQALAQLAGSSVKRGGHVNAGDAVRVSATVPANMRGKVVFAWEGEEDQPGDAAKVIDAKPV